MTQSNNNLVWLDMEMTGLYPKRDRIIEIATIITDSELNILAEGPVIAVKQSEQMLDNMDEWNTRTHNLTGLVDRVKISTYSEQRAEQETLKFLQEYVPRKASPLCGNTISQDRRFLYQYMPELEDWVHYRNLDVTSVKEIAKRWYPDVVNGFKKGNAHKALDDIRESIEELKYYRKHIFR